MYFTKIANNRYDLNVCNMFFNFTQKKLMKIHKKQQQKQKTTTSTKDTAKQATFQYIKAKWKINYKYSQIYQKY